MDAMQVGRLLNDWWPLRAGPPLPGVGPAAQALRQARAGWPAFTGSVLGDPREIPVLWSMPFEQRNDEAPAGLRRLADHPHTTGRRDLWLADPSPTWRSGLDPSPSAASTAVQFVMTLRHVAANLQDRATLPAAPKRSLDGEAAVYLEHADRAEELLGELVTPWQARAEAEIAAAAKTPMPPARPSVPLVPGQFR